MDDKQTGLFGDEFEFEMDKQAVLRLLEMLNSKLAGYGSHAELFIVGGAAMALEYDADRLTSDIDAILKPRDIVLKAARDIAEEHNIPADWLNDAVSTLMPGTEDASPRSVLSLSNLTVTAGSPEFILAMKSMVDRKSAADLDDAARICVQLRVFDEYEIERIVKKYFGGGALGSQELWLEDIAGAAKTLAAGSEIQHPTYTLAHQKKQVATKTSLYQLMKKLAPERGRRNRPSGCVATAPLIDQYHAPTGRYVHCRLEIRHSGKHESKEKKPRDQRKKYGERWTWR